MINDLDIVQWAYLLDPCFQLVNTAGKPLTEGYIEVYYHGTRTKYYCASDFDGTLHPFQIPLDSLGSNIVLASPDYAYDVYVYNKFGSLVMSRYNVTPGLGGGGGGIPGSDLPEHWLGTDGEAINIASDAVNVCLPLPVSGSVDYEGEFVDHFDDTTLYLNEGMYIVEAVIQFRQSPWDLHNSLNNLKIDTGDGDSSYYWQEDVSGPESNQNVHERKVTFIRKVSGEEPYPFFISPSVGVQLNDVKIRRLNIVKLAAGGTGGGSQPIYKPGPGIAVDDEGVISVTGMQPVSGMNEYVTNITYNNDVTEIFNEIHNVTGDITNIYNEIQSVTGDIHEYTAGSGIIIEDDVISLDPDYVASGAVTQEQLEGVTAVIENTIEGVSTTIINNVSGDISAVTSILNDKIDAVSAAVPEAQVNADWNATEGKAEILNKPDLSVYATKTEVETATGDLNDKIDAVSADLPDTEEVEFEELDVDSLVTNDALSSVTSVIENTIEGVSTTIVETIEGATSVIENTIEGVSTTIVNEYTGDIESVTAVLNDKIDAVSAEIPDSEEVEFEELDVEALVTNDELQSATSVIENNIEGVSTVLDERIDAVSAAAVVQSDWTEDDSEDPAYIKNKPEEIDLVAGDNISIERDGNDLIISASSPDMSPYATKDELQTVSGDLNDRIDAVSADLPDSEEVEFEELDLTAFASAASVTAIEADLQTVSSAIPVIEAGSGIVLSVSGDALVISATGAPTTKEGQFTIHPNTEGSDVTVIYPTDVAPVSAFFDLNAQYDDALSNRTGPVTYYYVFKSPGYDNDTWSANTGDVIQLKVKESIQGIGAMMGFYASNSSPASSSSPTINYPNSTPLVQGAGAQYTVEPGEYTTALGSNPAGSSYGKYITIMVATGGTGLYVDDILNKIEFTIGRPNSALGTTVNLSRYYLGNTVYSSTPSSDLACQVTVDDTTKQQKVYLPSIVPTSYYGMITNAFEYGSNRNSPSNYYYSTKQYRAYKYTSSPTRYQFAYCTDWDYANSIMTFVAYDNSGNAIEKWTLNYSSYFSNVWTTTPISAGDVTMADLAAVSGDLEADIQTVSAAIPDVSNLATKDELESASGTLDAKIEAVSASIPEAQVQSDWTETATGDPAYIKNKPTEYDLVAGQNIEITNVGNDIIIGAVVPPVTGFATEEELQTVSAAIPDISNLATKTELQTVSSAVDAVSGAIPELPEEEEVEFEELDLTGYASIASVTAVEADVQTVSAAIPDISDLATKTELQSASGSLDAKIDAVSGAIPSAQVQSDWTETASGDPAYIKNKPASTTLVAGSGITIVESGSDLIISATGGGQGDVTEQELATVSANLEADIQTVSAVVDSVSAAVDAVSAALPEYPEVTPLIAGSGITISASGEAFVISSEGGAGVQVQSDWTETATGDPAYIKNKPGVMDVGIKQLQAGDNVTITETANAIVISALGGGSGEVTYADLQAVTAFCAIREVTVGTVEHGSVSASPTFGNCGRTITLSSTPESSYQLVEYTVDGSPIVGNTFSLPTHDPVVGATFYKPTFTSYKLLIQSTTPDSQQGNNNAVWYGFKIDGTAVSNNGSAPAITAASAWKGGDWPSTETWSSGNINTFISSSEGSPLHIYNRTTLSLNCASQPTSFEWKTGQYYAGDNFNFTVSLIGVSPDDGDVTIWTSTQQGNGTNRTFTLAVS